MGIFVSLLVLFIVFIIALLISKRDQPYSEDIIENEKTIDAYNTQSEEISKRDQSYSEDIVENEKTKDAYNTQSEEKAEIYCDMAKLVLLCIFTFGIWYLIWIYKATKYLNRAPEGDQYDPTNKLLLCLFVPFYQIYWFYKHGQKLDSFLKARKVGGSEMATLCLILGIFIPIVACILMQDKFNQLCMVSTAPEQAEEHMEEQTEKKAATTISAISKEQTIVEDLKKYKELLDSGIITQEEFEAKKKQLLGL